MWFERGPLALLSAAKELHVAASRLRWDFWLFSIWIAAAWPFLHLMASFSFLP